MADTGGTRGSWMSSTVEPRLFDSMYYARAQEEFGRGINPPMFVRGRCAGANANGAMFTELQLSSRPSSARNSSARSSRPPSARASRPPSARASPRAPTSPQRQQTRPQTAPPRRDIAFLGKAGAVPVRVLRPATQFTADADRFHDQRTKAYSRRYKDVPEGLSWPDFSDCRHMAHIGGVWNGDPFYKADHPKQAARRYKDLVPTRIYGSRR